MLDRLIFAVNSLVKILERSLSMQTLEKNLSLR